MGGADLTKLFFCVISATLNFLHSDWLNQCEQQPIVLIKTSFGAFIKLDSDFCFKSGALELIIVIE